MGILKALDDAYTWVMATPSAAWVFVTLCALFGLLVTTAINWKSSKSLARIAGELQIQSQRHAILFSSLHERRIQAIQDIYSQIVDMEDLASRLLRQLRLRRPNEQVPLASSAYPLKKEEAELAMQLAKSYDGLSKLLFAKRIYLTEREFKMIHEVVLSLSLFGDHYYHSTAWYNADDPAVFAEVTKFLTDWGGLWEASMRSLESEIRTMLGVVEKSTTERS